MVKRSTRLRLWWRRTQYFVLHHVLHADDPPHRLALGVAVGVFVTFLPLVGFQMVVTVALAWLVRANKIVGPPIVWITNPVTMIPIFYGCYWVGCLCLGMRNDYGWDWWSELIIPPVEGWWPTVSFYWTRFVDVAWPLWVGSFVVALALAIPSYYGTLFGVRAWRMRRWGQLTPPTPTSRYALLRSVVGKNRRRSRSGAGPRPAGAAAA